MVEQNVREISRKSPVPEEEGDSGFEPIIARSSNYALNRPALQSSISEWSHRPTPAQDARGGNNGDITRPFGCHTSEEEHPWWYVDLGLEIVIDSVAIYNRQECAYRMRYFSLHGSLDGREWQRFYKKRDARIFGELADDIYFVRPKDVVIARFVRLQLDHRESLHFRECEIYGHRPSAAERLSVKVQENLAIRTEALIAGREGFIAKIDEFSVFVDEANYSPKIIAALRNGIYEEEERQFVERMLRSSDRVLEIGTGIGAVTLLAADCTSPEQVRSFDGNPYIIDDARRNFLFNHFGGIIATPGVLKNRNNMKPFERAAKFTVLRDFWSSRLGRPKSIAGSFEVVDVPIFCLETEIAAHKANVLIIDIEGGEVDLLRDADLSPIRLIIMETHYWAAVAEATDSMITELIYQGFRINLELTRWGVVVLHREVGKFAGRAIRNLNQWLRRFKH